MIGLFRLLSVLAVVLVAAAAASAQDFNKTYPATPGTAVAISTLSGDIKISSHSGPEIVVTGRLVGPDVDRVKIDDRSTAGNIDIETIYEKHCNCDVSVDFEVLVPAGVRLRLENIRTMSGDIQVIGVSAHVRATTMSGDVRVVNASGVVEATTMSGDVNVDIERLEGEGDLTFVSMSGDVIVRLPGDAGANVSVRTMNGTIENDFGLAVTAKKHGAGESLVGTIGDGHFRLSAKTMSGNVKLMHR